MTQQPQQPMVFAGTSGFSYKEWRGGFYPAGLRQADWLGHYAAQLPAVEINATFYRLPKTDTLAAWAAQVPAGFRFALKASRRITHHARLRDCGEAVDYLFGVVGALGEHLGPVLFQLPPNQRADVGLLRDFVARLPAARRVAMEFRHPSWFAEPVLTTLADGGIALCVADHDDARLVAPEAAGTTDWGYVRLRGQAYDERALAGWLARFSRHGWQEVYAFFKHDEAADDAQAASVAPRLAEQLSRLAVAVGTAAGATAS